MFLLGIVENTDKGRKLPDWKMVMTTTFIYALCEPGTRTVRYLGKADDVKRRVRQHRCEARQGEQRTHKDRWLVSLENAGLKPEIVVLSEVSKAEWKSEEIRFIRAAKMLGMNLVNGTDGGDGIDGYRHTEETKALLSKKGHGRKATKETRARMSEARSNPSPEFRAAISIRMSGSSNPQFGKKMTGATSVYPGVCWASSRGKWVAWVPGDRRHKHIGYFNSELEAHEAVIKKQSQI